jgi:uncharacterized cofD-like protein
MMEKLRIVGIGGGTGLPVLLRGFGKETGADVSAIVTMADDGGSSGRLRGSFSMPAVGDLRNCLVALSGDESALGDLFQHRFAAGGGLEGHALGNLIVAALYEKTGSLRRAVEIASGLLPLKGRAFPATETLTTLCAAFQDGTTVRGESQVTAAGRRIARVWLEPDNPPPTPGVLEALQSADAIVLAPGSLYTSLIPNLFVAGLTEAVRQSNAVKIMVCNLMTQPGETDRYSASDHLRAVEACLGAGVVDVCVVNSAVHPACFKNSRPTGSEPVLPDLEQIRAMGAVPVLDDLLAIQGGKVRHNSPKLARLVMRIARAKARLMMHLEQPRIRGEWYQHVSIKTRPVHLRPFSVGAGADCA